jgi:hypothetical protein
VRVKSLRSLACGSNHQACKLICADLLSCVFGSCTCSTGSGGERNAFVQNAAYGEPSFKYLHAHQRGAADRVVVVSCLLCAQDALEQQGLSCVLGARLAVLRSSVLPPPRRIPGGLVSGFSMQHRVPIHYGGIFLFFLLFRCRHCVLIHVWRYHACPLSGTLARRWCSRLTATADDEPRMLHHGCYLNA